MTRALVLAALAGCSFSSAPEPSGAPIAADFTATALDFPATADDARLTAIDLDGDGMPDNQLGLVLAAGLGILDVDPRAATDAAFAAGAFPIEVRLDAAGAVTDPAAMLAIDSGGLAIATGEITDGVFLGESDPFIAPFAISDGIVLRPQLLHARIRAAGLGAHGIQQLVLGGVVDAGWADVELAPALAQLAGQLVARDCTGTPTDVLCGCTTGSAGREMIALCDANFDCAITADEVRATPLFGTLFKPDEPDGISFAIAATAADPE